MTRHVSGLIHEQRLRDTRSTATIASALPGLGQAEANLSPKVISAKIMMSQFIAVHNLSFQSGDHLSDLVSAMFPHSKIAASLSCKHTNTKATICDAIDPHLKRPEIDNYTWHKHLHLTASVMNPMKRVIQLSSIVRIQECKNCYTTFRHHWYN